MQCYTIATFMFKDPVKPSASSTPDQKKKQEHKTVQASVSSVSAGTQVEIYIFLCALEPF